MRKAFYILGSLDDLDIEWIAKMSEKVQLDAGDILIQKNVLTEYLYLILDGEFSVRIGDRAEKEIAVLLPGEIVGEISFVDNRKPTASVLATQPSRVLSISRKELTAKLSRDLGFASRFYRAIASFLADRLSMTTSRLGYGSSEQDAQTQEIDEINDSQMDEISLAAIRFDKLMRYLADNEDLGSFASAKI